MVWKEILPLISGNILFAVNSTLRLLNFLSSKPLQNFWCKITIRLIFFSLGTHDVNCKTFSMGKTCDSYETSCVFFFSIYTAHEKVNHMAHQICMYAECCQENTSGCHFWNYFCYLKCLSHPSLIYLPYFVYFW